MSIIVTYSSIVDKGGNVSDGLEDILIRTALQTVECGIFIFHHVSDAGRVHLFICS